MSDKIEDRVELDIGAEKDIGRARENQEDEVLVFEGKDLVVLGVADGMGGLALGEVASRTAVGAILELCQKGKVRTVKDLERAVKTANEKIGKQTNWSAGTTLCLGLIKDENLWILNVGDSRAYLISHQKIKQLTVDHRYFPFTNIVTRSLGNEPKIEVDIFEYELKKGDFLLFCTDGLHDYVDEEKIKEIILSAKSSQSAAGELIKATNLAGGFDNVGVVVTEVVS